MTNTTNSYTPVDPAGVRVTWDHLQYLPDCKLVRYVGRTVSCLTHGGDITTQGCPTAVVLRDLAEERARQFTRYGTNADLEDGTGPHERWLARNVWSTDTAQGIEKLFRQDYEQHEERHGKPTWMHLVREEVAEAFLEDDPVRLREELLQVAALAVSWAEKLDGRIAVRAAAGTES